MATTWQFVGVGDETADIQLQDSTGASLATIRYDGDYNEPAALLFGIPESNWLHLMSQAQINANFDLFDEGTYLSSAPSLVYNSGSTSKHNEFLISGFSSAKTFQLIGSSGDLPDGTASSDNGVGLYFAPGDAGSSGTADGGNILFRMANNNGNAGSEWGYFGVVTPNFDEAIGVSQYGINITAFTDTTAYKPIQIGNGDANLLFDFYDDQDAQTILMRKNIRDGGWQSPNAVSVTSTTLTIPILNGNYVTLSDGGSLTINTITTTGWYYGGFVIIDSNGEDWTFGTTGNILTEGGVNMSLYSGELAIAIYNGFSWQIKKFITI